MRSGLDLHQHFSVFALAVWPLAAYEWSWGVCGGIGVGMEGCLALYLERFRAQWVGFLPSWTTQNSLIFLCKGASTTAVSKTQFFPLSRESFLYLWDVLPSYEVRWSRQHWDCLKSKGLVCMFFLSLYNLMELAARICQCFCLLKYFCRSRWYLLIVPEFLKKNVNKGSVVSPSFTVGHLFWGFPGHLTLLPQRLRVIPIFVFSIKTWTVNKVKRSQAYRHVVCCPLGHWGQREWPLRKNSHEVRWKSWVVRKENRRTDRLRRKGLSWKPIIMPVHWREDVCLHDGYQVVCNLPVSMSIEQKKLDMMVHFLLGKPLSFWTDLFYPPFLLCVFRANGNMFLFKPLTVSCRVPLNRWAVQSCSAASVNNCFDLHPRSCLPLSPCWVSDGLLLSFLAMMHLFWDVGVEFNV